jgi:hypothetical protein
MPSESQHLRVKRTQQSRTWSSRRLLAAGECQKEATRQSDRVRTFLMEEWYHFPRLPREHRRLQQSGSPENPSTKAMIPVALSAPNRQPFTYVVFALSPR